MQKAKQSRFKTCRGSILIRLSMALVSIWWMTAHPVQADTPGSARAYLDYYLVGIARIEGISYASLIDRQTNNHYLLSTKQSEQGLVLTSVLTEDDPSGPAVVIQKDGVSVLLKLDSSDSTNSMPVSAPEATPVVPFPSSASATQLRPPPGAKLPLIFQATNPQKLNLTEDQQSIIDQLRQKFIASVGGTGPGTPGVLSTPGLAATMSNSFNASQSIATVADQALAYWQTAQEQSDAIFKMQFGTQAFNLYQMALSHQGVRKG